MDNGIPNIPPDGIPSDLFADLGGADADFTGVDINQIVGDAVFQTLFAPLLESIIVQIVANELLPDLNDNPFLDEQDGVISL